MEIGIIGLPRSGKTTIFNALTKSKAGTRIGTAKVSDFRLRLLEEKFHPTKTIPAEVKYADIDVPQNFGKGEGIWGEFLTSLNTKDVLLHVVRAFEDERVPHPQGSVNPRRDIDILNLELNFSDLAVIEKKLQRLEIALKGIKTSEREALLREEALFKKIKSGLEKEVPLRQQSLGQEEIKTLRGYQFLTAKPILLVLNIDEKQIPRASTIEAEFRTLYSSPSLEVTVICGKLEEELSQLSEAEAREFRQALGLTEPAPNQIIKLSYRLLGLISFFTTVSAEVKAWTVPRGITALKAAGKIHSDIEKGFIRAEVISYQDFERYGSMAEARKHGLLRAEGKNYVVQDGDIITFLFHV